MLEVEVPPSPVKRRVRSVDGAVDEPADLVDGVGNFVFEVVPPCADPKVPGDDHAVLDFAANAGVFEGRWAPIVPDTDQGLSRHIPNTKTCFVELSRTVAVWSAYQWH